MITSPSESVKLTDAQAKQLEYFKAQLENMQNEYAVSQNNLVAVRKEAVTALKEKEYQQELLRGITERTLDAEQKIGVLHATIKEMEHKLSIATERAHTIGVENEEKAANLAVREKELSILEKSAKDKQELLNKQSKKLAEDAESIETAKRKFSEAIESVTWK